MSKSKKHNNTKSKSSENNTNFLMYDLLTFFLNFLIGCDVIQTYDVSLLF